MRGPGPVSTLDRIGWMRPSRTSRILTSWVASLAILMASFAPAISHALGANTVPAEIEVCTSIGAKWVQSNGEAGNTTSVPTDAHLFAHCPYCSLHANALASPPAPLALALLVPRGNAFPIAIRRAPRAFHVWASPQPRALPPLW